MPSLRRLKDLARVWKKFCDVIYQIRVIWQASILADFDFRSQTVTEVCWRGGDLPQTDFTIRLVINEKIRNLFFGLVRIFWSKSGLPLLSGNSAEMGWHPSFLITTIILLLYTPNIRLILLVSDKTQLCFQCMFRLLCSGSGISH